MKSVNKILVPLDLSPNSVSILTQAADIACYAKAQLVILHVYHKPVLSKSLETAMDHDMLKLIEKNKLNRLMNRIKEKYNNICQSIPSISDIHTKFIKTQGFIVDKIIEVNKEEQADLIIMGTRGVRGMDEFWGTKTAEICLNVTTPVLVIPYHFKYFQHDKIAFAYDLKSIHNVEDLDIVKLFSMVYNSEVHIITVHSDTSKIGAKEEENIEKLKHHFKDFSPIVHIEAGRNIERRVFKYLKENNISMLIVLHRSRKLLDEMFHESLTAKFTYHSDIPVLALDDRISKDIQST